MLTRWLFSSSLDRLRARRCEEGMRGGPPAPSSGSEGSWRSAARKAGGRKGLRGRRRVKRAIGWRYVWSMSEGGIGEKLRFSLVLLVSAG